MEIRDVLHGSILIEKAELPVIDSRYFQRLRQIKQLGFAEHSFPSATHNRYIHSLGAMHTATRAFDAIFAGGARTEPMRIRPESFARLRSALRFAALLHDVGHGPLSHTTEFAMPDVGALKLPSDGSRPSPTGRQATHEDYTLKTILDSEMTPLLARAGARFELMPRHVAALIDNKLELTDAEKRFFLCDALAEPGQPAVDFRPLLSQLVSSELDADRMDYLRRDSWQTGVSYGHFDFDWLMGNLTFHVQKGRAYLALGHRALYAFEDFLISRYHMFLMVYFHYKSVVYDEMLQQYFTGPDCDYQLPADLDQYALCDDAQLYSHLARSKNEWARRISSKTPFRMLVELHSGIPATRTSNDEQKALLEKIEADLRSRDIFYLLATSTGELSKYFQKAGDPIFVRYDNHYSAPGYIPLEQCTDLFRKYGEKRSITRLYVSPENYPLCRNQGRGQALKFD